MNDYTFKDPWWLAAAVLMLLVHWLRNRGKVMVMVVPFSSEWQRGQRADENSRWPMVWLYAGAILIIAALARPQQLEHLQREKSKGYDLMLCIDLSTSMLSEDYEKAGERINRLQAIKPVIQAFITRRPNDRIGVVVFSGRAYTLAPLTSDHGWLEQQVERLKVGLIEDGTAIGDGLGVALTRLEQSSRSVGDRRLGAFVVLLTDGSNNRGSLAPEQATAIARQRGIPVYTIGAGKDGEVPFPIFDKDGNRTGTRTRPSDLDETAMREIAMETHGRYFKADDSATVQSAFQTIDEARKIEFESRAYIIAKDLFWIPLGLGLTCWLTAGLWLWWPRPQPVPSAA